MEILELAKRRGFFWPSYEIYQATAGFFDYGPYGAVLKRKLEDLWRKFYRREGFHEIETPTVAPEEVFLASGHVSHFMDAMVECEKCGTTFKAEQIIQEKLGIRKDGMSIQEVEDYLPKICCECGGKLHAGVLSLMMGTRIGRKTGYIRPETAQGSYLSFKRLVKFHREKLPFGVIQVGKAYRNEISPRQGVLRLREFSMAELELFVHPKEKKRHPRFSEVKNLRLRLLWDGNEEKMSVGDAVKRKIFSSEYLAYHLAKSYLFLLSLGFPEEKIRFRKHGERERAHYALECWDGEIKTSRFGWVEVVGIADRGEYDLRAHSSSSGEQLGVWVPFKKPRVERRIKVKPRYEKIRERFGKDAGSIIKELEKIKVRRRTKKIKLSRWTLSQEFYQMEEKEEEIKGEFVIPHVVEPSYGIDRLIYTILENSYHEEVVGQEKRSVLKLPPSLAPVEVAVLPLLSRDELVKKAREIERRLRGEFLVDYDESGSIGRRYRRQDEIGTPFCITIDHATLEDNTVTIRERDTMRQERCGSGNLRMRLRELLAE